MLLNLKIDKRDSMINENISIRSIESIKRNLDQLYFEYNKCEYVHPDPLEFLYNYDDIGDREIVGLIASSLALGKVAMILKSTTEVLKKIESPKEFIKDVSLKTLKKVFSGFKHRFITGEDVASLLFGIKDVLIRFGSLQSCFMSDFNKEDATIIPALMKFVHELKSWNGNSSNRLLASPIDGSACKRLNLYLRWMVRKDDVDPGGWNDIPKSMLLIPLDVHMQKMSRNLGFTKRNQNDLKTALEITKEFAKVCPEDPTKYDFVLTRFGIRNDFPYDEFMHYLDDINPKSIILYDDNKLFI
jgi:uncharacterized protein (TIGR02757 family)